MYYIKIDDKEAFDWLKKLINNTMEANPNHPVKLTAYPKVAAWYEALENPMTFSQLVSTDEINAYITEKSKPAPKKKKKRAAKQPADNDPYKCKDHPRYSAARIPQSDCGTCWKLYKQFHPLEYKQKRAAFERKLRNGS